jgi:signal transduction histidine kinase/ActR/RegA family two-component response regulator
LNYQPVFEAMRMLRQPGLSGITAAPSLGLYALIFFLVIASFFGIAMWHHHCKAIPCDETACQNRQGDAAARHPHPKPQLPSPRFEESSGQTTDIFEWLGQMRQTPFFHSPLTALLLASPENLKILAANDRACALLGSSEDKLIDMPCDALGFSFDPHGPAQKNIMLEATRIDGPPLPVKAAFSLIHPANGRLMQISFVENKEVTTLNKQLRLAKATADAAQTAKGQFLANMNHEIRTPLNGIVSMVDLLMQSSMAPEHLEYVGIIQQSTKALVSIVNDVMDYCKIESGRIKIETANTELAALVASTAQSYSEIAKAKGVGFSCMIDPKLPKWIRCDPIRLRQILENLLDNAVKFTPKGNIHLHVELDERHSNSVTTRFQVGDSGIGISENRLATIFDSFSQGAGPSIQKSEGIGLGLTIAKHLIGLMGSEIQVESTPGQGTRFWFCIDFEVTNAAEQVVQGARGTTSAPIPSESNAHILLVEDNAVNQTVAGKILTKAGYIFDTVENGRQALELLTQQRYDLILMDIKMPEMDGLETTRRIRHPESRVLDRYIPIIAVTANAMRIDRQQCLDCGMNDYLAKPIDAAKLIDIIRSWLPAKHHRQKRPSFFPIPWPQPNGSCPMDINKAS